MRISITISEGSGLESKMKEFNKHERSAIVKMALGKWFCIEIPTDNNATLQKSKLDDRQSDYKLDPLESVMGDYSE